MTNSGMGSKFLSVLAYKGRKSCFRGNGDLGNSDAPFRERRTP